MEIIKRETPRINGPLGARVIGEYDDGFHATQAGYSMPIYIMPVM
jgi:hypothetical protein